MIHVDGRTWGTADEIAAALGSDVTAAMIRNWHRRDGLTGHHVGRTVYYPLVQAAQIEADKRLGGRGRRRQLDAALTVAA